MPLAPFNAPPGTTIIGEPIKIKGASMSVVGECQCLGPERIVLLVGSGPTPCPSCRRAYVITALHYDAATASFNASVGIVAAQPES